MSIVLFIISFLISPNRTILELKHTFSVIGYAVRHSPNRTILELKLPCPRGDPLRSSSSQSNHTGIETELFDETVVSVDTSQSNHTGIETGFMGYRMGLPYLPIEPYWN